jgi:hypothetical protein
LNPDKALAGAATIITTKPKTRPSRIAIRADENEENPLL